jgi:hypothetical protein
VRTSQTKHSRWSAARRFGVELCEHALERYGSYAPFAVSTGFSDRAALFVDV